MSSRAQTAKHVFLVEDTFVPAKGFKEICSSPPKHNDLKSVYYQYLLRGGYLSLGWGLAGIHLESESKFPSPYLQTSAWKLRVLGFWRSAAICITTDGDHYKNVYTHTIYIHTYTYIHLHYIHIHTLHLYINIHYMCVCVYTHDIHDICKYIHTCVVCVYIYIYIRTAWRSFWAYSKTVFWRLP